MPSPDYYQLLGINKKANHQTVRTAYRKALRRYHPDANQGNRQNEDLLRQVITAGRILCDPRQRARYDKQHEQNLNHPKQTCPPPANRQTQVSARSPFALLCQKIRHVGQRASQFFFSAEQAEFTNRCARQQPGRKTPGFNFYLYLAMSRNRSNCYRQDADGIYRKQDKKQVRRWRNRTAIWLWLTFFWEIWRN